MAFESLDKKSQDNITNLLNRIRSNECCAFIGAGLSRPAEYPLWTALLDKLKVEAENHSRTKINDELMDYYDKAEEYRKILGVDNYRKFILKEFDPENNKKPWLSVHHDLVSMPFISFITTNYDCLIENACRAKGIHPVYNYYPILPLSQIRNHQIYHIHGVIDYARLPETQNSMILTRTDFDEAYGSDSNLIKLLSCLYTELTMFFIGFNVKDPFMLRIIKSSLSEFKKTRQISYERGVGPLKDIKHYALLPYPMKLVNNPINDKIPIEQIDQEATDIDDANLESMGVFSIRYRGDTYNHTPAINIIHDLNMIINDVKEHKISQDTTFRGV